MAFFYTRCTNLEQVLGHDPGWRGCRSGGWRRGSAGGSASPASRTTWSTMPARLRAYGVNRGFQLGSDTACSTVRASSSSPAADPLSFCRSAWAFSAAQVKRFYAVCDGHAVAGVQACYHPLIVFSDPAFGELRGRRRVPCGLCYWSAAGTGR